MADLILGKKLNKKEIRYLFKNNLERNKLIGIVLRYWDIDRYQTYYGHTPDEIIEYVHYKISVNNYLAKEGDGINYTYITTCVRRRADNIQKKVLAASRRGELDASVYDDAKYSRCSPHEVEDIVQCTKLNDLITFALIKNTKYELLETYLLLLAEYTQEEIANIQKLTRNQVRFRISMVRKIVRNTLKNCNC